jgi:asparagine synthase (glutamine-hydrolysing)
MLDDVVDSCGEPFADYSVFPTMLISRMARRHVKVILSGDGGDELFWGYPSRMVPALKHAHNFSYPYWFRFGLWGMRRLLGDGKPDLRYRELGDYCRVKHTRIYESDLRSIFPEVPEWPANYNLFRYSGSETDRTAQWLRWNEFVGHLTMVLLKVDRASMHHSLEVRVPLLDREVIDIASRVDWRSCLDLKDKLGKIPLRQSLSRHVRFPVRAKRGFEAPMNAWLRGPLKDTFHEAVMTRKEVLGLPLNQKQIGGMFQQHVESRADRARSLWTVLSLALWEQRHCRVRLSQHDWWHRPGSKTKPSAFAATI